MKLVGALLLSICFSHVMSNLASQYAHHVVLDEAMKYHLYWTVNDDMIHFGVEVQTTGWVALGFSTGTGKMTKADIIMGWVKDGQGYIQDRFADGYYMPSLDEKQDVNLVAFKEEGGKTILEFTRKLVTCDKRDHPINEGTVRLIWAYHTSDPETENSGFQKHTAKDSKSVMLLNSYKGNSELPKNTVTYDFVYDKVKLPSDDTTYWCQVFKVPETGGKKHVVMIEPVIQSGNEGVVHHMVVYTCSSNFNTSHENTSIQCDHPNMPIDALRCRRTILFAWAVGAGNFTFPEHAGYSLGEDDSPKYVLLEIHYDNPNKLTDVEDSSGIRFHATSQLREHDADMLLVGHLLSWVSMVIPPKQKDFRISGYCNKECTQKTIPDDGMNVFAVMPHTHLVGHAVHIRHVRDGTELPPLVIDDNYDFNFQEYQYLNKEIKIKPGDEIITDCRYNTMKRANVTLAGESTRQEMCYGFMLYYPKNRNLVACNSAGLDVVQTTNSILSYNATTQKHGKRWDEILWKDEYTVKLQNAYENTEYVSVRCSGVNGSHTGLRIWQDWYKKPQITDKYIKKDVCNRPTITSGTSRSSTWLSVVIACSFLSFKFGFWM